MNIGLGIVGAGGYWGQKLLQILAGLDSARVVYCSAQHDFERLNRVAQTFAPADRFPELTLSTNDLLCAPGVEAVIIAAPAETHFDIARAALRADKHVFVEKPMCLRRLEAAELARLAAERGRVLFVDHTYVYSKCLAHMKARIDTGSIGIPRVSHSTRTQLGIYRPHGVLWDLAPHDLSILYYLFPEIQSQTVTCIASSNFRRAEGSPPDHACYAISFSNGLRSSGTLSWCHPRWSRDFVVAGTEGMLLFEGNSTVKLFRRGSSGADVPDRENWICREVYAPDDNPLSNALAQFLQAIAAQGREIPPHCRPEFGVRIVSEIERMEQSIVPSFHSSEI